MPELNTRNAAHHDPISSYHSPRLVWIAALCLFLTSTGIFAQGAPTKQDLGSLSLEELMDVTVTSVRR